MADNNGGPWGGGGSGGNKGNNNGCLVETYDAADELKRAQLGVGRDIRTLIAHARH